MQKVASPGFLVPQRGHVMPRPSKFTAIIAIPIVRMNPNVMLKNPSNVRQVTTLVCGTCCQGRVPTATRLIASPPATPTTT